MGNSMVLKINISNNEMDTGDKFVSLPETLNGTVDIKDNSLKNVKQGVVVEPNSDNLKTLILKYVNEDTPASEIDKLTQTIINLPNKTSDDIAETIIEAGFKKYLKVGLGLIQVASNISTIFSGLPPVG